MTNIILKEIPSVEEQIAAMQDDARYDVAGSDDIITQCTPDLSSVNRIKSIRNPPKVPKTFLSNNCSFNCAYCGCRAGNEEKNRYCHDPVKLAEISVRQALDNGHGVFITSAIFKNADYTQELLIETLRIIRSVIGYRGYIHSKIMPGADPLLVRQTGEYANRLSVNIEVAKSEGYGRIARQKNKDNILSPMNAIHDLIREAKFSKGLHNRKFATSQTTQLMAGSTDEDDRTIITLSKALYRKFNLSRVYYTPFQYRKHAKGYDLPLKSTPYWRMTRLYQADRLLKLYKFSVNEILPETAPLLNEQLDPKAVYAIRNIHLFPIDINKASFEELLRIPGIGITYAKRIMAARKLTPISFGTLPKIGVSLKRCKPFIECNGRYIGGDFLNYAQQLQEYLVKPDTSLNPIQLSLLSHLT